MRLQIQMVENGPRRTGCPPLTQTSNRPLGLLCAIAVALVMMMQSVMAIEPGHGGIESEIEKPTRPQMAPVNIVTGGGQVVYPDSGWWDPGYSETYGLSVISRTDGTVKGMLQTQWEDSVLMHAQIICLKVNHHSSIGTFAWIGNLTPER
jgi:hypothetical protein